MLQKIIPILSLCTLACLFTSCATPPYEYMDNWIIRQNAVPRYFADFDVIYIVPTMFQNPDHIHMNWSKPPLAQDVCDYIKTITTDVFSNKARIFAPFIHQVEYKSFMEWLPLLPLDDYEDTSLEAGINDTLAAMEYYFKHFHASKRPFIIIGHGQGAIDAYEAMKRCSDIKPENGFVAAYFVGIPRLTRQQIIDDFGDRGIMPAEGEFDTGVICTWNPIRPTENQSIFASPDSFMINPLNWKTDSTPGTFEEDITSVLYYHEHPDILQRLKPTQKFSGATNNPITGALTLNINPNPNYDLGPHPSLNPSAKLNLNLNPNQDQNPMGAPGTASDSETQAKPAPEPAPQAPPLKLPDRLEEGIFRSNRYGLFIGNVVINCRKRVAQYKHKLRWNITEQKDR